MGDERPVDPDPELAAILAEVVGFDRWVQEFYRLDRQSQRATSPTLDLDEAGCLLAGFFAAETDDEKKRVLAEMVSATVGNPSDQGADKKYDSRPLSCDSLRVLVGV